MKITISGTAGSGKGTISELLAQQYNLTIYDLGNMRRADAKKRGMTLREFNEWSEAHPDEGGDTVFDEKQKAIGENEDDFVFVGRLSWHFIPDSFKLFLKVSEEEAARRIFSHIKKQGRVGEKFDSEQDTLDHIQSRNASDKARYKSLYDIDHTDESQYDLVIDSTSLSIEIVLEKICFELDKRFN